jgi:threonine/homoserine/homoserine lactone efflux protein
VLWSIGAPFPCFDFGLVRFDGVSPDWQALTGELAPLALVVALSPFAIIPPLLLVLHAQRPRATGVAFGIGWFLGLGVCTAVFVQLPRALGGSDQQQGAWSAYVRIGIGAALILGAIGRWLTRHRATSQPAWLNGLSRIRPPLGFVLGVVLPLLNPKFLFANAAAGLSLGTAGLDPAALWTALIAYTALAASTAVLPVLIYAAAPARFDGPLQRLKEWIERQHAELTAVILVVIGIILLVQGIQSL